MITQNKIKLRNRKKFRNNETFLPDHLQINLTSYFDQYAKKKTNIKQQPYVRTEAMETNFGISVTNQFVYVLLHLRNKTNKNAIHINIPEVCVFHNQKPFDMIYSEDGYIRGYKAVDSQRLRLKDVHKFFKQRSDKKGLMKQQSLAVFQTKKDNKIKPQEECLLLSDVDLLLICGKIKNDPFFKNLVYLQNKYQNQEGGPIKTQFHCQSDIQLVKLATQSLLGFKKQEEITKGFSEQKYLAYNNQKIYLFLNYQHNIRISKANFIYMKSGPQNYTLINIQNVEFYNLTRALKDRQKRLRQKDQQRLQRLQLTPRTFQKYAKYSPGKNTSLFQEEMSHKFQDMMKGINMLSIQQTKKQHQKNEMAFNRLHPKSTVSYEDLLKSTDFIKTKKKVFCEGKKSLTMPSKYVLRYYNRVRRTYTQSFSEENYSFD